MDDVAQQLAKSGVVDMLDGGPKANPKPSLANGVPTIYTSAGADRADRVQGPARFRAGRRDAAAVGGQHDQRRVHRHDEQRLLRADVGALVPLGQPERAVDLRPANALPPDFAQIPPTSLAGAVLPTVAGTPQAQEAVIANSIPQTATVPLANGPTFTPSFDGPPQFAADSRHAVSYVGQLVGAGASRSPRTRTTRCRRRLVHRAASPDRGRWRPRCRT